MGADEARLLSDQTDDDGERRRTLEVTTSVISEGSPWSADEAGDLLGLVVERDLTGSVIARVGRVEDASLRNLRPTQRETYHGASLVNGREATVSLVVASRRA